MTRFYRIVHFLFWPIVWLLFPTRAHGRKNIPTDCAVVFCANHAHAIDPVLIGMWLPRRMRLRIMAKKEILDTPFVGWFVRKMGAFPVNRGHSDLAAVRTAIQSVRDGAHLIVFPEGTRVAHEGDERAKGGVVMIAMRTGAPLLPVYVGGRRKLFHMTHIVFGEPYMPEMASRRGSSEEYQECADEVLRRAYALGREWENHKK